jgi:hypothetical protein
MLMHSSFLEVQWCYLHEIEHRSLITLITVITVYQLLKAKGGINQPKKISLFSYVRTNSENT